MAAQAKSRAQRGADQAKADADQPEPQPEPEITVEPVPVTYYRPTVTMPDGTTIACQHKYLHEGEKSAAACGRRIADRGEFVK
jgi:hypothetical protein